MLLFRNLRGVPWHVHIRLAAGRRWDALKPRALKGDYLRYLCSTSQYRYSFIVAVQGNKFYSIREILVKTRFPTFFTGLFYVSLKSWHFIQVEDTIGIIFDKRSLVHINDYRKFPLTALQLSMDISDVM